VIEVTDLGAAGYEMEVLKEKGGERPRFDARWPGPDFIRWAVPLLAIAEAVESAGP